VFRDYLERHPRGPRALFGLAQSLRAQSKDEAAALVGSQLRDALKHADVVLRLESLR